MRKPQPMRDSEPRPFGNRTGVGACVRAKRTVKRPLRLLHAASRRPADPGCKPAETPAAPAGNRAAAPQYGVDRPKPPAKLRLRLDARAREPQVAATQSQTFTRRI